MRFRNFCIFGLLTVAAGCAAPTAQQNLASPQHALGAGPLDVTSSGPIQPAVSVETEIDAVAVLGDLFQPVMIPETW